MPKTEVLELGLDFAGHVQTEQVLAENFKIIDAAFADLEASEPEDPTTPLPAITTADIGKVLGVVDDGEGNPALGWVVPGA